VKKWMILIYWSVDTKEQVCICYVEKICHVMPSIKKYTKANHCRLQFSDKQILNQLLYNRHTLRGIKNNWHFILFIFWQNRHSYVKKYKNEWHFILFIFWQFQWWMWRRIVQVRINAAIVRRSSEARVIWDDICWYTRARNRLNVTCAASVSRWNTTWRATLQFI
jgi:lipopolysaccharide biosynthesis glycosyltransferase